MSRWWNRLKRKLKKPRAVRNVLRLHKWAFRKQSRVVAYTAPIVGAAIWGPIGAAAGTAVSQVAGKFTGWRGEKARKVRKQTLIIGGSSIAAAGLYSLAAGSSAAQGPLHSVLYGSSAATPASAIAAASPSGPGSAVATSGVGMLQKAVTGSTVKNPAQAITSPQEAAAADQGFVPSLLQTAVAGALGYAGGGAAPAGVVKGAEGALEGLAGLGGGGGGGQAEGEAAGGLGSGTIILIILALGAFMLFKK